MFKIWYLLVILLIVLVISVFLVPRFVKEGATNMTPVQNVSIQTPHSIIVPSYSKNQVYFIYKNENSAYPQISFDPSLGNVIAVNMKDSTACKVITPNGKITKNSISADGKIVSTQETSGDTAHLNDAWSYVTESPNSISIIYIPYNKSTYLYTIDVSNSLVNFYQSNGSVPSILHTPQKFPSTSNSISAQTSVEIAQYIQNNLKSPVTDFSLNFYNNHYTIITPINGSTPLIIILDSTYQLKYAGSGASLTPSTNSMTPSTSSGSNTTNSGSSTCTSNLINVLADLNTLADLTTAYGQKMSGQNGTNSKCGGCSSGSSTNSASITNGCASDNNNYMLKTEIVPPVCPQCPCGQTNCQLSINSNGQVIDCNGNPVTNFGGSTGVTPSSSNGSSSIWNKADTTIGSGLTTAAQTAGGVANTAITTTGNVASNVAGAGAAVGLGAEGAATNIAGTAGGVANNAIGSTAGVVNNTVGSVGSAVTGLESGVSNVITGLGKDVTKLGTTTINAVGGLGKGMGSSQASQGQIQPGQMMAPQVPYYTGYSYPYTGYGGYYAQPIETCTQSTYMPITNDFSAFGR